MSKIPKFARKVWTTAFVPTRPYYHGYLRNVKQNDIRFMKHIRHLFTALLSLCTTVAIAHDFEVDGICYNITGATDRTVEVTSGKYTGSVVVPESVDYDGSVYSVTAIGNKAFEYCYDLTDITIPNSITTIGEAAFYECTSLEKIVVDSGNTVFDSRDNCNAIIETASNTLIFGCMNTIIPNSVTAIGREAFYGCSSLTDISIPNSVTTIGFWAFRGCSSLEKITIPNSVATIGNYAFCDCSSLTNVTIGNSVTAIGDYALAYCNSLKNVTSLIPAENLFAIKENVFYNVDRKTCILYVPKGARRVYESTSGWNYFINVIDPEEPTAICDIPDAGTGAGTVYDLNGRAVKNPTNGIHIINGKKVMVMPAHAK